jgi:hypothetical protein
MVQPPLGYVAAPAGRTPLGGTNRVKIGVANVRAGPRPGPHEPTTISFTFVPIALTPGLGRDRQSPAQWHSFGGEIDL